MTFVIYVMGFVGAAIPAAVAFAFEDLRAIPTARGFELLDAARDGSDAARAALVALGLVSALTWLLSPVLVASWLAAASEPRPVIECVAVGLKRAPAVLGASTLVGLAFVSVIALGLGCALGAHGFLSEHPDARNVDLATLISLAPAIFLVPFLGAWHDLARAAVVDGHGSWRAVQHGFRSLDGSVVLAYVLTGVAGFVLSAITLLLAWTSVGLWTALLTQPCLFARHVVRSAWLVHATDVQRRFRSAWSNASTPTSP